ncbi:MAG: phosphatase PAP2 family protein, partial [Sciscionella sp.]
MRRPRWWSEITLGLAVFAVYLLVDGWQSTGRMVAVAHGRMLLAIEAALHTDVEHALNAWLAQRGVLRVLANYEYATTYVVSAVALLIWVYWRHPEHYRRVRNSFVVVNLVAMACFAVYSVTPPRMLPGAGFVDTVSLGHTWGSWGSPLVENANQVAAMPSLHVAWALWVSVVLARISGKWFVQVISAVHVLVTLLVIMATGNHYWLDAAGAAVLVWMAVAVTGVSDRRRVPASDTFFLHVESPAAPQHVGGLVLLDTAQAAEVPSRAKVEA